MKTNQPTQNPKKPEKHARNAARTRAAILAAALEAFSRGGYESVGAREIAASAGVSAMLINRYFGSKEELFGAVVEHAFSDASLFQGKRRELGKRIADALVQKTAPESAPIDPLLLLLHSASHPAASPILRRSIESRFSAPLAATLKGDDAAERAAMILAVMAGFQLFRKVIALDALSKARARTVATLLASLVDRLARE